MNEIIKEYLPFLPFIFALIVWGVHLEVKIATITNDVKWIKKVLLKWRLSSENHIP